LVISEKEKLVRRLTDLGFLFVIVAAVEAVYALTAILTPPGQIEAVTGWVLSADGKWLVKLLGLALASQAWVAWTLRGRPHLGVAKALALYQLGSATADWVMWIVLADQGVFSTTLGQVLVTISIPTHYAIGLLLVRAIRLGSDAEVGTRRAETDRTWLPEPELR
jgi:hypothetical protein